jgi:hypothetical protein
MKRTILIFLVVIALLTMAQECDSGTPEKTNKATFIGGEEGLNIQFSEEAPPKEVFDMGQDPFDVELRFLNKGETLVPKEKVKVVLSGLNPTDFGKTGNDFIIDGISQDVEPVYLSSQGDKIQPPEVFVTFTGINYKGTLVGNREWPIWLDVCYNYGTKAEAVGCIRRDVRGTQSSVCTVEQENTPSNSGAPVQVSTFQEVPSGSDRVRYFFTIKHVGSGRVFAPDSKCPTDRSSENKLFVSIKTTENNMACSGFLEGTSGTQGTVLLREGEFVLRCTQDQVSQIDYIDYVSLDLKYDYADTAKTTILVKKSS